MNKKLMAVAVAGALAAPASAFAAAELYGRVNLGLDQYSATGATAGTGSDMKSRMRIFDNGSKLGVRGGEDLGGGLKVVYLIESGVNVDTGSQAGQSGAANANTGFLGSRVGHVGLEGGFGKVAFGKQHFFWGSQNQDLMGAVYVNIAPLFGAGVLGRGMGIAISANSDNALGGVVSPAYAANVLQYTSPKLGPVEVVVSYVPLGEARQAGAKTDGKMSGITVQGNVGNIFFGIDQLSAVGNTGLATMANPAGGPAIANPNSGLQEKMSGLKIRGGIAYQPGAMLSLLVTQVGHTNQTLDVQGGNALAGGAGVQVKQRAIQVNWEHQMGNIGLLADVAKAQNVTGCTVAAACANTNATALGFSVRYLHSKSTWSYVSYNMIKNAANYNADMSVAGYTSVVATGLAVGADPKSIAVGVSHNF